MKNNKYLIILLKYAACIIPAGLLSLLTLELHGFFLPATSEVERYRILADAFTIPGVVLVMVAALVWISNSGGFDGIGYALKATAKKLIPFANINMPETYYEYVERQKGKRLKGYHFILISGGIFLVIALFFMYKFYQLY